MVSDGVWIAQDFSFHINAEFFTILVCSSVVLWHQLIIGKPWAKSTHSPPSPIFGHRIDFDTSEKAKSPAMESPDRMPPLIVSSVAIVGIVWVLMVLGIRLYLRCKLNGPIGNDDYAAILATSLGIAQSALVLASVNSGLGKHPSNIQDELINEERIVKVSLCSLSASIRRNRTTPAHTYTRLTNPSPTNSSATQQLSYMLQQPTSLELRAACYTYA
jgi:hypothetical protein